MFEEILRSEAMEYTRDDPQAVVAEQADAIAVQRNGDGDIVIWQHRPMAGADPHIVVPREEAGKLIEAIRREMTAAPE
jgi:hypothetical protein